MTDAATTETTSDHSDSTTPVPYRSGFVAVVGRPNVGKSTLINALIGTQIAIASSRPETTRKAIRGILTTENAQIVLVDTPGIHRPRTLLGQRLNDVVDESLADVDAIAFLLVGCTAVQVGTANLHNPYACMDVIRGMEEYGEKYGVQDVRELIGALRLD